MDIAELVELCGQTQDEVGGVSDPAGLTRQERGDYWMQLLLGLTSEVAEVGEELGWKPWKQNGRGLVEKRPALYAEMADVLIFTGALIWATELDPERLSETVRLKLEENLERQRRGY